ncbi:MAG: CHAD domain-containing protein, partial [Chroococcidiopsidaceae cyanobacterium CP_BM_RX_35]|nr:CHAD domain-containing protein [Chroococcidiopsidaceae cyanobacterium CP_BM_RX_35]
YQMEVFAEFYGSEYDAYLQDVKEIQGVLGKIQDGFVLAEFLSQVLKSEVKTILPTLANQLAQTSYVAWQQWQILQQRYLNPETRQGFHLVIIQPTSKGL